MIGSHAVAVIVTRQNIAITSFITIIMPSACACAMEEGLSVFRFSLPFAVAEEKREGRRVLQRVEKAEKVDEGGYWSRIQ